MNSKILSEIAFFIAVVLSSSGYAQPSYREKYADVLCHYSQHEADSLKYRAALFLIDNMDGHLSPEGEPMERYAYFVRTMKKTTGIRELQAGWNKAAKSGTVTYKPDSAVVDGSYLTSNIESAFAAWEQSAWRDEITFDQFCCYILPYRVSDEHIGQPWREMLRRQYGPLIEDVTDMKQAFAIVKDTVFKAVVLSNDYCPHTLDPLTCHAIGRAECGQRCVLLAAVLRALCIPSAIDITPMWADYSNKSHAWVSMVMASGDTYTVWEQDTVARMLNPIDASQFLPRYKICEEDRCPYTVKTSKTPVKVYRTGYERDQSERGISQGVLASPFVSDVSKEYGLTADVTLPADSCERVWLCAYLSGADWMPVASAMAKDGRVTFCGVGSGSVCTAAAIRDGKKVFLTTPFLAGENGVERYYTPSGQQRQTIQINRKYPLCSYITDTWGYMRGAAFEASMTEDFSDADTLATIAAMPYGMTTLDVKPAKRYRYLRYHAPANNRSSLAELQFYTAGSNGQEHLLTGSHTACGMDSTKLENVFDGNPATAGKGLQVGYTVGIDLGQGRESAVSKIVFSPSTDLNFVEQGHLYELLWFDTEWHLVGRVYSKGDSLEFDNVPKGALLLLKDRSGGVEERIFEYVDGRQVWH